MSKRPLFTRPFDWYHCRLFQTLPKSAQHHLYHIYWSLQSKLSWKKSLLVIYKILGKLVNTLTIDEKYYFLNNNNLTQPFQMQLSEKKKPFSHFFFFFYFWNLDQISNILKTKMTLKSYMFRKLRTAKNVCR